MHELKKGRGYMQLNMFPDRLEPSERLVMKTVRKLRGVKTVMSWSAAPEERLYHTGHYDPFFAAAQDAGVSISMHEITARRPNASAPPDRSTIDGEVKFMDAVSWNFIREMQGTISKSALWRRP